MTDKELLELAAKAAGIRIDYSETNGGGRGNTGFDVMGNAVLDWHNGKTWNPLTDDGAALRLAARLKLTVDFETFAIWGAGDQSQDRLVMADGTLAGFRRAIVVAAAEIGKGEA